ncbi:MAG: glycosyltransferase family 9 protein [Gammaproteobacteria bacterium]|nr:glycosyltransferase family 9 protein [Gammaproteobacteria bacterium]MDH4253677.1 glycosyltransferase family 9 protein [Gammaproteobacteria bacterium]MDH5311330.1 glycosyltransferase family 9 protein [Gammaproteobacteria bacterium]
MLKHTPPESICVIRLSAIGDTCHALAVVRSIQDSWPETRLTWIIGKTEAALLGDIPGIEFIIFDKSRGQQARRELRRKLADRRFDAALCMHASMRVNLINLIVRSPVRIGYDFARARDFQWLFTNHRIPATRGQHVLDAMMEFARTIGVPPQKLRWDIPLTESQRDFAEGFRVAGKPLVVISPCSSQRFRNFRNWSAENYAAAANHAVRKYDCQVLLTGGNSATEREYGRAISKMCERGVHDLVGQTSLKQLLALLAESDLVLCPDSGPAHMATAVGTPVVGLYATSNPERTGPYLSRELTVNVYPEACRQFLGKEVAELRWGQRVRDPGAMGLIRLAQVTSMIDRALARSE